jgi:hypothetical protein
MKKSHVFLILLIIMFFVLPPRCGGIFSSYNVSERDTTIYNVTYRDSVIYNVVKKDSVITDYRLVSVTEFDTMIIHDTTYIAIPIASYRFADTMSDIWASGYRVTLDSVRYHFRDVTKMVTTEKIIAVRPKILTADVGGMLIKTADRWMLTADIRAAARINDRWSVEACAGVAVSEHVMPFAALGARRTLGAE